MMSTVVLYDFGKKEANFSRFFQKIYGNQWESYHINRCFFSTLTRNK